MRWSLGLPRYMICVRHLMYHLASQLYETTRSFPSQDCALPLWGRGARQNAAGALSATAGARPGSDALMR